MVRRQAAFHSALVMCVARSQKPMQSCKVLPPPPGGLGADSLGLLVDPAPPLEGGGTVHFPAVPTMQATVAGGRPVASCGHNDLGRLRRIRKLKRMRFC